MKTITRLLVTFALLVVVSTALAGSYRLNYESGGQVSLALNERFTGSLELVFQIMPLTGDHSPGPAVVRLDGVPVWITDGSEYWGTIKIPENGIIPALNNDDLKKVGQRQPNISGIKVDYRWFMVDHQIEVFFLGIDGRGRTSKNNSAAPATQFRLEQVTPVTAAITSDGTPMTSGQLDAAIRNAYEQGSGDGKAAGAQEREQLLAELKKATDELNELRRKVALSLPETKAAPEVMVERYIPFRWDEKNLPKVGDIMIITKDGKFVAEVKVVEVFERRVWVYVAETPVTLDKKSIRLAYKPHAEKN